MHNILAWSAVLCLGLFVGGWIEETPLSIPEDAYGSAALQAGQSGSIWADVIEKTIAFLGKLFPPDADMESACCYSQGCDCGRIFSQCPMCAGPRSWVSTWTVDNVEWILRNTIKSLNGQCIFYLVSGIMWLLVVVFPVIRLKSVWFMRHMKKAQKDLWTKMIVTLKSHRKMADRKDAELSSYFQQNDTLWRWYDQAEMQFAKRKRLLRQKSREMDVMATTIEGLSRQNERYRRGREHQAGQFDEMKIELEQLTRLNDLYERPMRQDRRQTRQDFMSDMAADCEDDFGDTDSEVT